MPYPVIVFNASTGSDTQASGAPANMPAIFGSNAVTTNGSATIDLSADNPDLSNVPTDTTAVIFVNTSSGRKFFKIVDKDNTAKTVTVYSALPPQVTGTFSWAIGGKRSTFDLSRGAFADMYAPLVIETETDQSYVGWIGTANGIHIRGSDPVNRRTIVHKKNEDAFSGANAIFSDLKFINTAITKTTCHAVYSHQPYFRNCIFGDPDPAKRLLGAVGPYNNGAVFEDCLFDYCLEGAVDAILNGTSTLVMRNCVIRNGLKYGIKISLGNSVYVYGIHLENCIFYNNALSGVYINKYTIETTQTAWNSFTINGCVFYQNGQHGIKIEPPPSGYWTFIKGYEVTNCIFAQNGSYGIDLGGIPNIEANKLLVNHNCYWQNVSGAVNNFPLGPDDLFVDPQFADPANLDFRIGPNLKAKGWPKFDRPMGAAQTNTYTFVDIGAAQREEAATSAPRGWVIGG